MEAASFPHARATTVRILASVAIVVAAGLAIHDALGLRPFGTLPLSDAYTPVDRLVATTRLAVLVIASILIAKNARDGAVVALAGGLIGTSLNVDWNIGYPLWPPLVLALVADGVGPAIGLYFLLRLAARSDASAVTRIGRMTLRAAPSLAATVGATALVGWGTVVYDVTVHPEWAGFPLVEAAAFDAYWGLTIVAMTAMLVAAAAQFRTAPIAMRERRLFVLGGLSIYAATQIFEAVLRLAPSSNDAAGIVAASNAISAVGLLVLALLLAYALLTRDVLGVDLLIDRSVVAAIVSVVFVSLYYLTDAFVVPTIEAAARSLFHIDENAEVTKLIVLFPVFFAVHKSFAFAEELVKRYSLANRERVARLTARLGDDVETLADTAAVERTLLAGMLASGAVTARLYFARGARFRLASAAGDRTARLAVAVDRALVRTLVRTRSGVVVRSTHGAPVLVCPMLVGSRVYGLVVLGPRAEGAAYAVDEVAELGRVVQAAGLAHRALARDALARHRRPPRLDAVERSHHRLDRRPLHAARGDEE